MKKLLISGVLLAMSLTPAAAATITVSDFTKPSYNAQARELGITDIEDFESFSEGNVPEMFTTRVGTFSRISGTGRGGTVTRAGFDNDGSLLTIRDGNVYGRQSTTKTLTGNRADDKFLDSNDTHGIRWDVSKGGSAFTALILTLGDAADTGASMVISVNGVSHTIDRLRNGAKKTVTIDLGEATTSATVFFSNLKNGVRRANDGFSLDDVGLAAVPLPTTALLLLGGLGGLVAMRRRKTA